MEKLMQYLWATRAQLRPGMTTVDSIPLQVINPGRLNTDSGPDFFNAKVKIGEQIWAGNVEIHVKASDWHRHGHDADPAYDSVILHVVGVSDTRITTSAGRILPQIELPCSPETVGRLSSLTASAAVGLPCASTIDSMPSLYLSDWLAALAYERVYDKTDKVEARLRSLDGDWEETAYITLARALGFNTNSDPFERLARATPLRFLRKHSDDTTMLEAMLLGQGSLIPAETAPDSYAALLSREYSFLAGKFGLQAPGIQWKMSRMRPPNFPHRRVALLAGILAAAPSLMSAILAVDSFESASKLFNRPLTGYWSRAYTLSDAGAVTEATPVALSRSSVMSLIINVVVPLKAAWGMAHGFDRMTDEAIAMLHDIAPENNRLTRCFDGTAINNSSAFVSQALIQLRRQYCEGADCLRCRIGHRALKNSEKSA